MNNQENITKLSEIRDSVKKMILEYNTISHSIKLKTRLTLITHNNQDLLTDEQIDKMYDDMDNDVFTNEYLNEITTVYDPLAESWTPSSLEC